MENAWLTLAGITGGALLGGPVWGFLASWLGRGDKEIDRLRADYSEMKAAHKDCEERLVTIERRLESVEHHHSSLVPRWIKDANKRIRWINGAAMVAIFGPLDLTRDQVEGHTFSELLDMEASREIDRMDRAALARPGSAISSMLQLHQSLPMMHIIKVAGVGRDSELIYEGYALCVNDPADVLDRGTRRQEEQLGLSVLRMQGPGPERSN